MRPVSEQERLNWLGRARPTPPNVPLRGLGDVVAAVTSAVGIKPCGGCAKRQDTLNRAFPFKQEAPVAGTPVSDSLGEASDPVPGQADASLPASAPQMPPEASDAAGGP